MNADASEAVAVDLQDGVRSRFWPRLLGLARPRRRTPGGRPRAGRGGSLGPGSHRCPPDRYPRAPFDFDVGTIRWSWRVGFSAYSALGTDHYPPFTLAPTDYSADFDVDYPAHLSHRLVLVTSWLLAAPHLIVVAVLTGNLALW